MSQKVQIPGDPQETTSPQPLGLPTEVIYSEKQLESHDFLPAPRG